MVGPAAKREAVAHLRGRAGDERVAGLSIVAADRKMIRYRSRRSPDTELCARLRELANHLTATGRRAALHLRALSGCSHRAGDSNRHWMKVQWQVTRSKRLTKARAA
jgi:putative transposase